jgi:signal transduction histidine kinase
MNKARLIDLIHKFEKISLLAKISFIICILIMGIFFCVQCLASLKIINSSYHIILFGFASITLFAPPFFIFINEIFSKINIKEKRLIEEIIKKNTYLEHATKILRHDMHSGINTYIPRGISSLKRRLPEEAISKYRLESSLKLISEGLIHSQQVYKGIYEFTNLVRDGVELTVEEVDLQKSLNYFLKRTAYYDQVCIENLGILSVNEALMCTAIDNLIRNGLKYNDSATKIVKVVMLDEYTLAVEDNGRGMTQEDFEKNSKPYFRDSNQKEGGTGLGISISLAILKEHGFSVSCVQLEQGTSIRIKIK